MIRHKSLRAAVFLAMLAHLLAPNALAGFSGRSLDAASLICAPSGSLSSEGAAAIAELLDIIDSQDEQPAADGEHCPSCVLGHGVLLSAPLSVSALACGSQSDAPRSFDAQFFAKTTGPPLGQRGPPIFN